MNTKKLEDIGFYTLTDKRAMNSCVSSNLERTELIITSLCNFKCPYCRGTDINGSQGHMELKEIKEVINTLASEGVQNIRFSGGEPTIHPDIKEIVRYTKTTCKGVKNIAISTNGSRSKRFYQELIDLGVSDFSISLDACCAEIGDKMAGGREGVWKRVVSNIEFLSKQVYVTVGIVIDHDNVSGMRETIMFAHNLGVSDIRLISAAQWDDPSIFKSLSLPEEVLEKHPIMRYRLNNFTSGRNVRGLRSGDSTKCALALDDVIVKGKYHYKCVIHMREGGDPLGEVNSGMREVRETFYRNHDAMVDAVCRKNCLDVCIDYNNKHAVLNKCANDNPNIIARG